MYLKLEPSKDGWFMRACCPPAWFVADGDPAAVPGPRTHERVVLVLASWRLGADLQNAMGGKDRVLLDAGMWSKELQRTSEPRQCKINVPEGMQVVLLGRVGMEQLLGTAAQVVLDKILEAKNDAAQSLRSSMELYRGAVLSRPGAVALASSSECSPCAERFQSVFELESFLRDEAKIDEDGVRKYRRLLTKNNVNEARLHLLTDAMLRPSCSRPCRNLCRAGAYL